MKKLLTLSLIGSSLLLGSNHAKADWDFWAVDYSGDPSVGNRIYTCVSETSECTLRTTKVFQGNAWAPANSYVNDDNELVIYGSGGNLHSYNFETNTWTDKGAGWTANYQKVFERPDIVKNSDGSVTIGQGDSVIGIDNEGIEQGGEDLLKKKSNGEIHIGQNSWITKEENGRQKVWAKNAAGNSIPIDYTNGTKLLINGRDVEQSINNVGALSAALTGLPTVPTDTTLACGIGTGTHGGDFAFSGGCASKVNEKLSINYAASMTMPGQDYAGDFEDTFSARAGFVWKLGKSIKPTLISMKAKEKLEEKIYTLEENNKKIISQNTDLKQKNQSIIFQNKELLARLERLEKVALGESKSKDLATIKLP